jgi:tetratricopeptide (TPR) repeat protein
MPPKKSTHVDNPVAAGQRLREARERAGLSQRRLAFEGCSAAYISRVESGGRIASLRILHELARRLDVTEEYLATGSLITPLSTLADAEVALRLDDTREAARLFQEALKDARGDEERARTLEGLGQVAVRCGDPALAIELFEKTMTLVGGDVSERPVLAEVGDLARSIALFERCVEASAADPVQYIRFAALLGAALTDNGSFAEAERVLAAAIARGGDVADPYTRARLYWSESRLCGEQGQNELAARSARRTLEILEATEDNYAIAHALQNLAAIYLDMDRAGEALEILREGRELIGAAGTPLEIAQYRIEEARALAALGEQEEAAALAMKIARELEGTHPVDTGRVYALLGGIFTDLGDDARARELLELAVDHLERQPPSRHLVDVYKRLAALLKRQGDTGGALEVLERALGVHERARRPIA